MGNMNSNILRDVPSLMFVILIVQDNSDGMSCHLVEEHNVLAEAFTLVASCPGYLTIRSFMFHYYFYVMLMSIFLLQGSEGSTVGFLYTYSFVKNLESARVGDKPDTLFL